MSFIILSPSYFFRIVMTTGDHVTEETMLTTYMIESISRQYEKEYHWHGCKQQLQCAHVWGLTKFTILPAGCLLTSALAALVVLSNQSLRLCFQEKASYLKCKDSDILYILMDWPKFFLFARIISGVRGIYKAQSKDSEQPARTRRLFWFLALQRWYKAALVMLKVL